MVQDFAELLGDEPGVAEGQIVVIGCGNLLRSDDAVGPIAVRHLWERLDAAEQAGAPRHGVHLVDGGTAGMDVAFKMRGAAKVILIDASATGAEPGTVYRIPGSEIEQLPPLQGLHSHQFRWDHALAFAHWLLGDEYPGDVEVFLVEAANVDPGWDLTEPVTAGMEQVLDLVWEQFPTTAAEPAGQPDIHEPFELEITEGGYARFDAATADRYFASHSLVAMMRSDGELWLMPVIGPEAGGLLIKQRNAAGDRAVLIHEHLPKGWRPGRYPARWHDGDGALRVLLEPDGSTT